MRLMLRLLASVIVTGLAGSSVRAQPATAEAAQERLQRLVEQRRAEEVKQAELKKAQEQLEKLLQQLKEQENKSRTETPKVQPPPVRPPAADPAKKPSALVVPAGAGDDAAKLKKLLVDLAEQDSKKTRPDAAKQPTPPAPPAPPAPPTPPVGAKPTVWSVPTQGGDATAALKSLIATSKDPKTIELAKQLLEQLAKASPKAESGSHFQWNFVPLNEKPMELRLEALKGLKELEFKLGSQLKPPVATQPETAVERRVVTAAMTAKPGGSGGSSTLKMSADGKLAALVGADGAITIFDVATGKEMMKFAGR